MLNSQSVKITDAGVLNEIVKRPPISPASQQWWLILGGGRRPEERNMPFRYLPVPRLTLAILLNRKMRPVAREKGDDLRSGFCKQ